MRRVSRRQLERIDRDLSRRERAVLGSLADFHFMTTAQLRHLHFVDHATNEAAARICRRVLHRLAVLRVIEPLERRIGGIRAGSASFVWRVGTVGDRLLSQNGDGDRRRRRKEPSLRHLNHCLAVADCAVALESLARGREVELLLRETEPACWRPYLGDGGNRETLKPDLFAATAAGAYEDRWFIEVDCGTESLPTLLSKCAQYERYRRTGREQTNHGIFPAVVWVLPTEARLLKLAAALHASRSLDEALFRLTTPADFAPLITRGAG